MAEQDNGSFIVSREDWSLHRKGYDDQIRHKEKVQEAIRKNLSDLVSEENIVMSNGRDVVRIPIRSLDEFRIRYNYDKNKHVGQGDGDTKPGDVVAREPGSPSKKGKGAGEGAGDGAGEDVFDTEVSLAELEEALFAQLALPNLRRKEASTDETTKIMFNDLRRTGLMGNIDKKKTMLAAFKRNALEAGTPSFFPVRREDFRFRTWNEITEPDTRAVVFMIMDVSGSMGNWEKYMARSCFFWMNRFLRSKYKTVEVVFIAHHTEAKVVSEEEFFTRGESGGTICSSAYARVLELIKTQYAPTHHNIYTFHFSDGDNLSSDNKRCVSYIEELLDLCNLFGYGEVNQYNRHSTLMSAYKHIKDERFRHYILKQKTDVLDALKTFFHEDTKV
ncbi:MAG: sporulation protein YhbH [Bacilli bacterium]